MIITTNEFDYRNYKFAVKALGIFLPEMMSRLEVKVYKGWKHRND